MPFSIVFVGRLIPLSCTAVFFVRTAVGGGETFFVPTILAVQLIVGAELLYLLWSVVCRVLFRLWPGTGGVRAVAVLLGGQVVVAFLPVYLVAAEQDVHFVPLWRVWQQLLG
jgi:hypothetical protein